MDAKIQKWTSLPPNLSDFVCAVPLAAIECKALAGILPEQCPRLEHIQVLAFPPVNFVFNLFFMPSHCSFACSFRSRLTLREPSSYSTCCRALFF